MPRTAGELTQKAETPEQVFYTIQQVAVMFQVSAETIRKWIKEDKLNAKKYGKNWRITRQNITDFVEASK